ncbi:MAG: LssY C-terminal domain-containing protein [Pirellulaceae bacterium]
MDDNPTSVEPLSLPPRRVPLWKRLAMIFVIGLALYLCVAYLIAPDVWKHYTRHHPSFDDNPRITQTSDGHPGDPLNVGLIGTETEVREVVQSAGWHFADRLSMKDDLKIGTDTILKRSYDDAPVSNLFLFGRKEDLAFEQPVGGSPRHRHHVRFWRTGKSDSAGRPIWIGAASYDRGVGFSHTTGQITHHIESNVDAERDHLIGCLQQTSALVETYELSGFHQVLEAPSWCGSSASKSARSRSEQPCKTFDHQLPMPWRCLLLLIAACSRKLVHGIRSEFLGSAFRRLPDFVPSSIVERTSLRSPENTNANGSLPEPFADTHSLAVQTRHETSIAALNLSGRTFECVCCQVLLPGRFRKMVVLIL